MSDIYILDARRTAIGKFGGSIQHVSSVELGAAVVRGLLEKNNIRSSLCDQLLMGNVLQAGEGQNIARQIAYQVLPEDKTACTLNMVCGSGMKAVTLGAQALKCGDAEVVIAGGTESMSNAAYVLPKARAGYKMGHGQVIDTMISDGLWDAFNDYHMGITAENLAEKYAISREAQDAFAAASQQKCQAARDDHRFQDEIIPLSWQDRKGQGFSFDTDEFPRNNVTTDSLARLRPAFKKDGSVTAANASGINDGAAALLLANETGVKATGCTPVATVVSYAEAGCNPGVMGIGPVAAVRKALARAGWSLADVELIEANEAFAVQSLAVGKELGWNPEIVNVNGGAIALGHPIGASGARIMVTLIHEMKKRQVKRGLATLCIGGGMGIATCIERVL